MFFLAIFFASITLSRWWCPFYEGGCEVWGIGHCSKKCLRTWTHAIALGISIFWSLTHEILKEYAIDLAWQHIITHSVCGTCSCTFEREQFVVRGSRFPDDEDRDSPRNVGLFATEPPDAVAKPRIIYWI